MTVAEARKRVKAAGYGGGLYCYRWFGGWTAHAYKAATWPALNRSRRTRSEALEALVNAVERKEGER